MHPIVIVPTYNERDNLPALVGEVLDLPAGFDILVVDDNSPDGTGDVADRLAEVEPRLAVLHREAKAGLGTAYVAGFAHALARSYDAIFQMDADFSHRPADLLRLLDALATADVAIGSRWVTGGAIQNWQLWRRVVSRGGSLFARTVLGVPIRDLTAGFKGFRREVLEQMELGRVWSNGYGFQVEMNYRCHRAGFCITEVPVVFPERRAGSSKMTPGIVVEAARLVVQLRLTELAVPGHFRRADPVGSPGPGSRAP